MNNNSNNKRILYVENGIGYGGAIICLRHLVRNLDRNQYTPMVITGRISPQYKEIADEALWKHIPDRYIDIVGVHQKLDPASWPDKIPGLRFMINQMLARTDDLVNFLPFFLQLLWTTWRFKADLIHVNNEPLCNRAALLVGKILHIPTVCHVRGELKGSKLMAWSYSLVDHFIPVSHWVADSIKETLKIAEDKITVIYDGIALDKLNTHADGMQFRQQFDIAKNCFAVGLVGLLIPWKGQEIFLDAAKLLKDEIPHLKMLIIGGTPDDCVSFDQMLHQRVKDEDLESVIAFTGHVSDIPTAYNGIDIVLSASTSPEPLGTVVIEAMAMGRPLIGPNHGGAAEMMEHEKTGLLFNPGDGQALAESIKQLYNSNNLRKTLGENARIVALKTFSVELHTKRVQQVYSNLFVE